MKRLARPRAVLGLSHPVFGKNFDHMNQDTRDCGDEGLAPVSRRVKAVMSASEIRKRLERAFRQEVRH